MSSPRQQLVHYGRLLDYLPAILNELGGYINSDPAGFEVVGVARVLKKGGCVLRVSGVGGLHYPHALVGEVAGIANVDRLIDLATLGILLCLLLDVVIAVVAVLAPGAVVVVIVVFVIVVVVVLFSVPVPLLEAGGVV